MSRDLKYIGMDVHKEAVVIAVRNSNGQLVMESIVESQSQQPSAVYPRTAGRTACHLGRRHLGSLALRPAEATCAPSPGLQSAT
jgi:hypothetical protein